MSRLIHLGVPVLALLLLLGSYRATAIAPRNPRIAWWLAVSGAAILGAWGGRASDSHRRRLEHENAEAAAILEISQMANAAVNLEATLNLVAITLQRTFGGPACAIFLANGDGTQFEMMAGAGVADVPPLDAHLDDHGWSPASGIPLLIDDAARGASGPVTQICPECRSILCIPLRTVERVRGLLYVGQRAPDQITERQVRLLEMIASRIIFPIERLRMQETLEREAAIDPLTGVLNLRRLEETLAAEAKRADRYWHPLSVIMLDVDRLTEYNDRYGHGRGNQILKSAAQFVIRNVRAVDTVGRYGSDEFCVICPETDREDAFILAERLCRDFTVGTDANTQYPIPNTAPPITLSGGVATYPEDARTPADLMAAADAAVAAVKRLGGGAVGSGGIDCEPIVASSQLV